MSPPESWRKRALFETVSESHCKGPIITRSSDRAPQFAKSEPLKREEYLQKALGEFEKADYHFALARNSVHRAPVKNNVGLVLFNLNRYREAHKFLLEAQRITTSLKDKVRVAQIDETRAQVFIAENKLTDAETAIRQAIRFCKKRAASVAAAPGHPKDRVRRLNSEGRNLFLKRR